VNFLEYIWLIPLFPLAGAALMLLFGRRLEVGLEPHPHGHHHDHDDEGQHHHDDGHQHQNHGHHHGEGHHSHHHHHDHLHGEHQGTHPHAHHHHHADSLKWVIALICPGMLLLAFLFSAGAVRQLAQQPNRIHEIVQFTWIAGMPFHMANGQIAAFQFDWGFLLDPLSGVMILVVTGVGSLIHLYAIDYMHGDHGSRGSSIVAK
jgi:NADH:ubiquinone oxidoreductase subunit 5 (subunit L)/multisubunit Na+/H+ antiporter MnhA subunit